MGITSALNCFVISRKFGKDGVSRICSNTMRRTSSGSIGVVIRGFACAVRERFRLSIGSAIAGIARLRVLFPDSELTIVLKGGIDADSSALGGD